MSITDDLKYLESNLDNLITNNGRHSKLPKIEGKCYISAMEEDVLIKALSTTSSTIRNKTIISNLAFRVRCTIDSSFDPFK